MSEINTRDFSKFDSMSAEELNGILRADAQSPDAEQDVELLWYVMEVLASRRKNSDDPGRTTEEAFEEFKQDYMPQWNEDPENTPKEPSAKGTRPSTRWMAGLAAAAALVLISAATAGASDTNIWEAIAGWTRETFHLGASSTETTEPSAQGNRSGDSLQEALENEGMADIRVPTYIPEGYEQSDISINETPVQKDIIAVYKNGEKTFRISITKYLIEYTYNFERSEEVEAYVSGGITYYIFENYGVSQVVWGKDSYECYISGPLTIEEMKRMIDSVERE